MLTSIDISSKTYNRIRFNFCLAFGYNLIALPFAAGVFYPLVHAAVPPWAAGLAMACSSVSVVLSSLALKFYRAPLHREAHKKDQAEAQHAKRDKRAQASETTPLLSSTDC